MKAHLLILLILTGSLGAAVPATDTFTGEVIDVDGLQRVFAAVSKGRSIIPRPEARDRAVVNSAALPRVMEATWKRLDRYGIRVTQAGPTWDERFDCVAVALAFNLELRSRLFREYWGKRADVRRPACLMVEYVQDRPILGTIDRGRHAIVFIVTERGPVWWDPAVGEVTLSDTEIASLYFFTP